jgi:uncharacterized membrane protein
MTPEAPETKRAAGPAWKKLFFRGLVLLLPTIITLFFLLWAFRLVNEYFVSYIYSGLKWVLDLVGFQKIFGDGVDYPWAVKGLLAAFSVIIGVAFLGLAGLMIGTLVGKRLWAAVESRMTHIPLVRYVYPFIREVTDLVFTENKAALRSVVVVEYPRLGCWSLGFLTGPGFDALEKGAGRRLVCVFLPASPTPMTGYLVFVPAEEVVPLDISVDEAFRLIMSGGVIVPGGRKPAPAPPESPADAPADAGAI